MAFARQNSTFHDSTGYHESSHYPLLSERFLAGRRSFPVPLFWKLVGGGDTAITVSQLVFSIACWYVLAVTVAAMIEQRWVRRSAFVYVLLFSLATPIVEWDRDLLSESVTLSLTALLYALALRLVRRPRWSTLAAALGIGMLWAFARDSNSYAALLLAPLLVALLLRRRGPSRLVLVAIAVTIAVFAADYASAQIGHRADTSLQNLVRVRLFADQPSARAWMEVRGYTAPTEPNTIGLYRNYLLHHPLFTLTGPLRNRPSFSDGPTTPNRLGALYTPHLGYEKSTPRRRLPVVVQDWLLAPGRPSILAGWLVLAAALSAFAAWAIHASRLWLVPLTASLATYPQFVVVWNGDEHEVDRHALVPATTLRLGAALLLAFALDGLVREFLERRRSRPVSPAISGARTSEG